MGFNINVVINILGVSAMVAGIIFIMIQSRRHRKKQEEVHREFLEAEDAANAVRKKEIEPDLFFIADLSGLPAVPEGDPHNVERAAARQMIYFRTPISNLELKREYGPAQMDVIAQYEENFNDYLKCLTNWATDIAETRNPQDVSDSLLILGYTIAHGTELRNAYKLAADLYAEARDFATLEALMDTADRHHFRDPAVKRHIVEYIGVKLEEIK